MSQSAKIVLLALILAMLPGCATKKVKAKAPSTAQAPTTTDQTGAIYPPPFLEKTEAPLPPAPEQKQAEQTPAPEPPAQTKPSIKKKEKAASKSKQPAMKPAETSALATAPQMSAPGQQTANAGPAVVSPIGQLSSGEGAAGSQKRHETSDLISSTEQGLNGIKRSLSSQEQETSTQIRAYLKQAKRALTVDDLDGATTLATKAKVLLEELTKP